MAPSARLVLALAVAALFALECNAQTTGPKPVSSAAAEDYLIKVTPSASLQPFRAGAKAESGASAVADVSIATLTLGPCAYRALHYHYGADETFWVVSGFFESTIILPNNTLVTSRLRPGGVVEYPKGLQHLQYNPGCEEAKAYVFFNAVNVGTVNTISAVAAAPVEYSVATLKEDVAPPALWVTNAACEKECAARRRR